MSIVCHIHVRAFVWFVCVFSTVLDGVKLITHKKLLQKSLDVRCCMLSTESPGNPRVMQVLFLYYNILFSIHHVAVLFMYMRDISSTCGWRLCRVSNTRRLRSCSAYLRSLRFNVRNAHHAYGSCFLHWVSRRQWDLLLGLWVTQRVLVLMLCSVWYLAMRANTARCASARVSSLFDCLLLMQHVPWA